MKKEVLIAIAIGLGIGLLITFSVYSAQRYLKEVNQIQSPVSEKATGSITPSEILPSLSLTSPIDESISKEAKISVIGITSPSAWVVILTEKGELTVQADTKGNFETSISLISGENEIEVKSFGDKGEVTSKTVTVVYSTVEI